MRKYHQNVFSSGKQNNLTLFVSVAIAIQIVPQEKELYFFCGSLMKLTNFALPLQVAPIKSLGMLSITISPTVSKCSVHILLLILLLLPLFFFFFSPSLCTNKLYVQHTSLFAFWDYTYINTLFTKLFWCGFFPFCLFRSKINDHSNFHMYFTTKQYFKPTQNG